MFTVSILKDTNRLVATSSVNWSNVKAGSFFRFKKDPNLYSIIKARHFTQFNDFKLLNARTITINTDVGINLLKNDELNIIYKEYEIITIFNIINKGTKYKIGDKLKLNIDNPSYDISSGLSSFCVIEVLEVNSSGGIEKINLEKKGRYLNKPISNEIECSGGHGIGCKLDVLFKENNAQEPLERKIEYIQHDNPCTIYLNAPLPTGVVEGRLSVNKWELFITSIATNNIINSEFDIIQDFTPNYHFGLLIPNSISKDPIINNNFTKIDIKLKELEDAINRLTNH